MILHPTKPSDLEGFVLFSCLKRGILLRTTLGPALKYREGELPGEEEGINHQVRPHSVPSGRFFLMSELVQDLILNFNQLLLASSRWIYELKKMDKN